VSMTGVRLGDRVDLRGTTLALLIAAGRAHGLSGSAGRRADAAGLKARPSARDTSWRRATEPPATVPTTCGVERPATGPA
jgi:hypothetical protein